MMLKRYQKTDNYSYCFGAFPTFELLKNRPNVLKVVLIHSSVNNEIQVQIKDICDKKHIEFVINDKLVERIRDKDAHIVISVFEKYTCSLNSINNHVLLVEPSDYGNIGTIIRTCVGFGIHDLAIIGQSADLFNPKVIRASMGAFFKLNIQHFKTFQDYKKVFLKQRQFYPFMLKGAQKLGAFPIDHSIPFSLIFGNEATGLDDSFLNVGQSILIPHSKDIDSLNLSLAVGIALYEFTKPYC